MANKGSFIGFTFGNRHSSQLGILRTSDSGRFSTSLSPLSRESAHNLGSADGSIFVGSEYTKREIPISFAFYGMTEKQVTKLRQVFSEKKLCPLILDEEPYKVWLAKPSAVATIKHVCFERDNERFYAGEGSLIFSAYYPYAQSRYEYIEDYTPENIPEWDGSHSSGNDGEDFIYPAFLTYGSDIDKDMSGAIIATEESFATWLEETELLVDSSVDLIDVNSLIEFFTGKGSDYNIEEWREASGIPSNQDYGIWRAGKYKLFNAGDIEAPFKLYLPVNDTSKTFEVRQGEQKLILTNVIAKSGDSYVLIDMGNHIVCGADSNYKKTKNLYNEKITEGTFFKLPTGEVYLKTEQGHLVFKYLYI